MVFYTKWFFRIAFVNGTATLLNIIDLEVLYFKSTDWLLQDLKITSMGSGDKSLTDQLGSNELI